MTLSTIPITFNVDHAGRCCPLAWLGNAPHAIDCRTKCACLTGANAKFAECSALAHPQVHPEDDPYDGIAFWMKPLAHFYPQRYHCLLEVPLPLLPQS